METYTLADVLDYGTAVLVDLRAGLVITWNESATFNVFQQASQLGEIPAFHLVTAFTNFNVTSGTAPKIAKSWLKDAQENHDF